MKFVLKEPFLSKYFQWALSQIDICETFHGYVKHPIWRMRLIPTPILWRTFGKTHVVFPLPLEMRNI